MSRKIRTIFKNLKSRIVSADLLNRIVSDDYLINLSTYRPWVTGSQVIFSCESSPHRFITIVKFNHEYFIVIPENKEDSQFTSGEIDGPELYVNLLYKEISGLKAFLWSQIPAYQKTSIDENDLLNDVFRQPARNIFDIADLEKFFVNFDVWKLDSALVDIQKIEVDQEYSKLLCFKLYAHYLLDNIELVSLNFENTNLITNLKTILTSHGDILSIPIFRGITSTNWEHLFLEFYRCIERLYGFPVVQEIISSLSSASIITCDFDLLIKNNEKKYHIRPNELIALTSLFELPNCAISINRFANLYNIGIEKRAEKTAAKIYGRRNSIAHWRKALDDDYFVVNEFFIEILSDLMLSLYNLYGPNLRAV